MFGSIALERSFMDYPRSWNPFKNLIATPWPLLFVAEIVIAGFMCYAVIKWIDALATSISDSVSAGVVWLVAIAIKELKTEWNPTKFFILLGIVGSAMAYQWEHYVTAKEEEETQ